MAGSKHGLEESIEEFEKLKPQMDSLRVKVQEHLKNIQSTLISKRATYEKALAELNNEERELDKKIRDFEKLEQQLRQEISKEIQDRDNSSMKVKEMKVQEEQLIEQTSKFQLDIDKVDEEIEKRLKEVTEERNTLTNQRTIIDDRTFQYEELLGMRIETGGENNQISFIFNNVDPDDFEREVYFVLDPNQYRIVETSPKLDEAAVTRIMDEFRSHKGISYLWRDMRKELAVAATNAKHS
ncbi:hypothetical protein FOA43_001055 [Brettanomyces nanus]|uniref:Kinetochore protein SPC25 n=1 Tax=Eeniella nana TaxID=13502 RepID=A0A875S0V2_EENNA|nr:uncharacterized protein FOA43_001055 [Brettanomyces nanus]QPG73742.1 hypothetical protein FOA43_001055 [Brettanomyces nanus]